jgi:hypothetical protein
MEVNPFRRLVATLDRGHWWSVSEFAHIALYHMKDSEPKELLANAPVDEFTLVAEVIAAMIKVGFVELNPWDKTQIRILEKWYEPV